MRKDLLAPSKKIYDPIHGFIRIDEIEKDLIDSYPFQRLHYIRQLGLTYLIYPGATHTRFEHSLGVMHLSSIIFKRLCKTLRPDVFNEVPRIGSDDYIYSKQILRLAALCHDLGHLPFSHVAEKKLLDNKGHEKWTLNLIESPYLEKIWKKLQKRPGFENRNIKEDVIKTSLGEEVLEKQGRNYKFSAWEKILSLIISADFFGADRIDYLLRDSKYTGVVYGLFDYLQLIEMMRILPSKKNSLALGIDEGGLESCEALLLARHFMHKRVYKHPSVKAFNFHLSKFMTSIYKEFTDEDSFLLATDAHVIAKLTKASLNKKDPMYSAAVKIVRRKDHFKAIPANSISEKDLEKFKNDNKIKDDQIYWEFEKTLKKDFSFLVSRKNLKLAKASDISSILSYIPPSEKKWVYIAPQYEVLFLNCFKK